MCVCMSHPVIHQGVYVCFQVHMEMVVCWEGVRPPVCAKVVSWEMRAGARGQVGDSVQPLGGGLCSQMSMHLYRAGLGPQASPWPQMQTLALLFCRSVVSDSATPWTVACWASLSFAISWSLLRVMSSESMTPSNHLILCRPLLLLPSIFPSIRVFSRESALCIRWPEYWSFSFSISPSIEAPLEPPPSPLWSNQPSAPGGKLIAMALPALPSPG